MAPMSSNPASIEVVRGRTEGTVRRELIAFWTERRALSLEQAEKRLPEVVCVARVDGKLTGACSVFPAEVPLIGGRRFWVYRSLLDEPVADQAPSLIKATFDVLDGEFDGAPGSPIGLCVLAGEADWRSRPEAEWSDPRMIYAGYLADGRQVRIAYFQDADII
jgi:hypothetical protein